MKIVRLTAENFKKLVAVEIRPDGSTIMLTGKNGAGKSSVLDAIMSALCGKDFQPDKPIREGQDHAEIVVETENYIVKRTFTESGGGTLTVVNAEGFSAKSPQGLLDKIVGEIAFDPMMFTAGTDKKAVMEQRETLMKLAGLDFADIDAQIAEVKSQRSIVKSTKESFDHEAERIGFVEGLPEKEVSMSELTEKLQDATTFNAAIERAESSIASHKQEIVGMREVMNQQDGIIKRMKEQIAEAEGTRNVYLKKLEGTQKLIEDMTANLQPPIDATAIQQEIQTVEQTNFKIRQNLLKKDNLAKAQAQTVKFAELGKQMKALEESKATKLAAVKMPIDGLSVTDDGVIYNGIPLSQVNDAKKLEIGVAISMAMNPTLKVILIRNGSLLDSANKAFLSDMVEKHGYQVWMEVTDDSGKVGLVIEDGSIVANNDFPTFANPPVPDEAKPEIIEKLREAQKNTTFIPPIGPTKPKLKRKGGEQLPLV